MSLPVGDKYRGFLVQAVTPIELMSSVVLELVHVQSGLRVLHMHNSDLENLFALTIPTPPPDDTGVSHILEHSVLAGSRRFPSREGFLELMKRSVATVIGGMTNIELTAYPVASTVPRDLFNLAEVYWDAVFHPLLTEHTFEREAHRLEFASAEDAAGPLVIKGIVYSEMQGAYSASEELVNMALMRGLFPDSTCGRDAGGDPQAIPSLTLDEVRAFHARYYRLEHAFLFLYGNIPTERYLEFLEGRMETEGPRQPRVRYAHQPRFTEPRRIHMTCPVPASEAGKGWLLLGWLTGEGMNLISELELALLHTLLLGHPGAVLAKTLLDAKIGEDLALCHQNGQMLDAVFTVGVRGASPANADAFVELVTQKLQELTRCGFEREAIETAYQQLVYDTVEISNRFPVQLLWQVCTPRLLGSDPVPRLDAAVCLRQVRDWALEDPTRISQLIEKLLLANPHRVLVVAEGDPDYARRRDQNVARRLQRQKAAMSPRQLAEVLAAQHQFEQVCKLPMDTEALERLPHLRVSDLPRMPRKIPTELESVERFDFLDNHLFANHIGYLNLDVDLSHLPCERLAYVGLFARCLDKVGSRGQDWTATAARIAASTGGISAWAQLDAYAADSARTLRSLSVRARFLDGHAEAAVAVLDEVLHNLEFDKPQRLAEILTQARAEQRSQLAARARSLAQIHAARSFSPEAWLTDEGHGLPQLRLVERLEAGFAAKDHQVIDETIAILEELRDSLAETPRLCISFTGSRGDQKLVRERIHSWTKRQPAAPVTVVPFAPEPLPRSVGLAAPMDVGHCAYVLGAPHWAEPENAALQVGIKYFSQEYLFDQVRLRGSAYDAWGREDALHRYLFLTSYRDPSVTRTAMLFRNAVQGTAELPWTDTHIERTKLVCAGESLMPNRPAEATATALHDHVHGLTYERRQQRYQSLLSVTPRGAREALLRVLEDGAGAASLCIVASREKLEGANLELSADKLAIEEVFP